jgi:hypothetical protein
LTFQRIYLGRSGRLLLLLVVVALTTMAAAGSAVAKRPVPSGRSAARCGDGYKATVKVVRKSGKKKRVVTCRRSAASTPETSAGPSSAAQLSAPSVTPIVTPLVEAPPISTPTTETPTSETPPAAPPADPQVQAVIGQGFSQNPLIPDEVTWHYSASATRTTTKDGAEQSESIPLPEGRLVFYVDGRLDCEIEAGGAIVGSTCTVSLQRLGAHEVETIFSGATSSTVTRTDYINKYPTSTSLQVSVEPTPPEYLDIGPNKYGYDMHAFEVGRLRISGSTTPGGYPTFSCEDQPPGCVEPEVGLGNHRGSVSLPLYALNVLNMATGQEEWEVAFRAYSPSARESGYFWQFPAESVGKEFLHVVSEPNPELDEPSSATVPLDLNGGHYPFYRWMRSPSESGGSIAAVEGVPQKVLTIGTYTKLDGPEEWLSYRSSFWTVAGESEGCDYRLRVDGQNLPGGPWEPDEDRGVEFNNGWPGYSAGPHTFELWVERTPGAGPGNCAVESGSLQVFETLH